MNDTMPDADGAMLLTSVAAGNILKAAVSHAGGELIRWNLENVDLNPGRATMATYAAVVSWPYGHRRELLGVSMRVGGLSESEQQAEVFTAGEHAVAVWIYPHDPQLPGLVRAAYPISLALLCNEYKIFSQPVKAESLKVTMIGYRPQRRAVLRVRNCETGETVFIKALREQLASQIAHRHEILTAAQLPVARLRAHSEDHLLLLDEIKGTPLANAIFDFDPPCQGEDLLELLASLPSSVAELPRRAPWTQSLAYYANIVAASLPVLQSQLDEMCDQISLGTASLAVGNMPTHGDFHEGQLHVDSGKISGLLDIDTIGPGQLVDDLACLVAHMSTIQNMHPVQERRIHALLHKWVPVFDRYVDPVQLRLRTAAVIVTLATGPYRSQDSDWELQTRRMITTAEALLAQVC